MFCGSIAWFTCLSVAAVIAVNYSAPDTTTESPTVQPYEEVKQTTAVDLPTLLHAGEGAMVTLVAGSTRLAAHKAVLASRSPVFAEIFGHDTLEASGGQLTITDVEGPVLRHLLAYLYSLQAPQLPSMAPQLLVAADRYGVLGLKADCEQQVEAQLSVETAASVAVLAVRHSDRLKCTAVNFIKAHLLPVLHSQGWADMMLSHPRDLLEVIQLLSDPSSVTSMPWPATADSNETTPSPTPGPTCASASMPTSSPTPANTATQLHGDHSQTATSAAPPTAVCHTPPPDDSAVSRLRNLSTEEKGSRLVQAAKQGAVSELRALLAAGAGVGTKDRQDSFRRTALHWAADRGDEEVAGCLLAAGAQVDARECWEQTPLHWAVWSGRAAVERLLLQAGADVNATNDSAYTSLHFAAWRGYADVAAALLRAGADRGATDKDGKTALDLARQHGKHQLVEMLS